MLLKCSLFPSVRCGLIQLRSTTDCNFLRKTTSNDGPKSFRKLLEEFRNTLRALTRLVEHEPPSIRAFGTARHKNRGYFNNVYEVR